MRVLAYFASYPEACDDAEGIARWRLRDEDVRVLLDDTARALEALVRRGVLERTEPRGRAPLYRLAPERTAALGVMGSGERSARGKEWRR